MTVRVEYKVWHPSGESVLSADPISPETTELLKSRQRRNRGGGVIVRGRWQLLHETFGSSEEAVEFIADLEGDGHRLIGVTHEPSE